MKRTIVELNDEISTTISLLVPGAGTFEHKSFHMARHLTSNLVAGAGNLTNSNFKSSCVREWAGDVEVSN